MALGGQEMARHRTTHKGSYAESNSGLVKGVPERRQVEDALRHVVEGTSAVVGKAFYAVLVRDHSRVTADKRMPSARAIGSVGASLQ